MIGIIAASIVLQFAAGLLALRLIAATDRNWAWTFLSAGIFTMAFRRTHTLYEIVEGGVVPALSYELLGLGISVLVFLGVFRIGPLLREMKETTRRLAKNEERYRTVAMFTHDWEYWLSPEGRFLYVSPSCKAISGYDPDAFINDPQLFYRIIHPQDHEAVTRRLSAMERMGAPLQFDCRIVDRFGETKWIAHNSLAVRSEEGVFLGIRASVRDIGHRKALEGKLRESRALYRSLVENARSMVLRLNSDGIITFANRYAVDHLVKSSDGLLGKGLSEVFGLTGENASEDAVKRVDWFIRKGEPLEIETEIMGPDGTPFWGEWVGSAVRVPARDSFSLVCVGIDVTRRKALDKLRDDVRRIVRHDLKSPLSGIIGIPRLLCRDDNLTPRQVELLKAVEDAGTIMLDLINQSLNLYKLETGAYQFTAVKFNIHGLLDGIIEHLRIGGSGDTEVVVSCECKADGGDTTLCSDRPLVFTMLANLVKNAMEASDGKPVEVDVILNGDCVVKIRNAGVVPEAIRESFFDKYVTKGKSGGTGLGTYSARLIARRLGGDVTMRSSKAEGTLITVRLPREIAV